MARAGYHYNTHGQQFTYCGRDLAIPGTGGATSILRNVKCPACKEKANIAQAVRKAAAATR